jgi:hypothetical protein
LKKATTVVKSVVAFLYWDKSELFNIVKKSASPPGLLSSGSQEKRHKLKPMPQSALII